jgi:hypothetical protein
LEAGGVNTPAIILLRSEKLGFDDFNNGISASDSCTMGDLAMGVASPSEWSEGICASEGMPIALEKDSHDPVRVPLHDARRSSIGSAAVIVVAGCPPTIFIV